MLSEVVSSFFIKYHISQSPPSYRVCVVYRKTDTCVHILQQILLQEQRTRESSKVGREEEGVSSNRPDLVALRECLEAHEDHVDLLYLTDSERLNLSKSPDADILKAIIVKLQKRVEAGVETL